MYMTIIYSCIALSLWQQLFLYNTYLYNSKMYDILREHKFISQFFAICVYFCQTKKNLANIYRRTLAQHKSPISKQNAKLQLASYR